MAKNIVLCCDGTGNEFGDQNSNVVKLYSTLLLNHEQAAYYHPGVGTMGSPQARGRLERTWTRLKGLAFGAGLIENVADAYRYLMNTYADGDRIFLFGFSGGPTPLACSAESCRCLVSSVPATRATFHM